MGARRVYNLLAALLFCASCAYMAAAVYSALQRPRSTLAPAKTAGAEPELYGILLRREEPISPAMALELDAAEAERVAACGDMPQSAAFVPHCDGYEHLSPGDANGLTPEKLGALLSQKASSQRGPKLVYGFEQYYAAFYQGGEDLEPGVYYLRFEGAKEKQRAEIISVQHGNDGCAVLIRLMLNEESLSLRLCRAELIIR